MSERADTLRVYNGGDLVFSSNGSWLHPLFDLEDHLATNRYEMRAVHVEDTIVGKAAAMLMVRMGVRSVYAGILSIPGEEVFRAAGVVCDCGRRVDRIDCRTEELLASVDDIEQAYTVLRERAGRPA